MKRFILIIFSIIGISLLFNSDTFAISDVTVTLNSSQSYLSGASVFPNCNNSSCLSQYSYITIQPSTPVYGYNDLFTVYMQHGNDSDYLRLSLQSGFSVYAIRSDLSNIIFQQNYTPSHNIVLTLTDHLGQPCPDCPDCEDPEENSRFIQVVLDAFWKYHIAFAGVAAALIAIFLIYRVLKGLLR